MIRIIRIIIMLGDDLNHLLFHLRTPDYKCRGCVVMIAMITAGDAGDAQ